MAATVLSYGRRLAAGVVLLFALGACNGVTISRVDVSVAYWPENLGLIGAEGNQMRVEIHGNPYTIDDDEFADAVIAGMTGRNGGPVLDFAVEPKQEHDGNFRIVLAFNPNRQASVRSVCEGGDFAAGGPPQLAQRGDGPHPAGGPIRVIGAYCQAANTINHAIGRTDQAPSADSEGFDTLIAQITYALLPSNNPHRDECSNNADC